MTQYMCDASWVQESSLDQTLIFLRNIALVHAAEAGPYRETLCEIIAGSHWDRLVSFDVDYSRGSPMELYHCRQALALFQKLEQLPLGVDKEEVAWNKFLEAEALCKLTNDRLKRQDPSEYPEGVASVLLTAQRKISDLLGPVPKIGELQLAFGPGANVGIKSVASSARWKLQDPLRCSANMASVLQLALEELPLLIGQHREYKSKTQDLPAEGQYSTAYPDSLDLLAHLEDYLDCVSVDVEVVKGTLSFAKKNAKTYRSIVVEPPLNTLFQKGLGSHIRGRLRKAGIDLNTLAMLNKHMAQVSSVNGRLATVDLSMASDTIAKWLVELLLPYPWYHCLGSFRTGRVQYKGHDILLEKFSSMGNAYTFELESMIFYALAWSCCSVLGLDCSQVSSFGDDIIIPTEAVTLLYSTFQYCGFVVNTEKSFTSGPFRESCGGDYVHGIDIRPYYQKDLVSGQTLFALHNYYVRTLQPECALLVLAAIHPSLLLWGPDGYGDGHLIGTWEHVAKTKTRGLKRYRGSSGSTFETFTLKQRLDFGRCNTGDRVLPSYSIYTRCQDHLSYLTGDDIAPTRQGKHMSSDHFVVRGDMGYKRISIYTFRNDVFMRLK